MDFDDFIFPIQHLRERIYTLSAQGNNLHILNHKNESLNSIVLEINDSTIWINKELSELKKLADKNYCSEDYEFYAIPKFESRIEGAIKILHYILFRKRLGEAEARKDLTKRFNIINNQIGYFEEKLRPYH